MTPYRGMVTTDWSECLAPCTPFDLFMINSTGAVGYFQRVFAKGLLSPPEVLAAHPMIRYAAQSSDPGMILPISEISDKPLYSAAAARHFGLAPKRIVVIGDSGADEPHFAWGARVASLAKPSLIEYCRQVNITIHHHWHPGPAPQVRDRRPPSQGIDLGQLTRLIRQVVGA